MIVLTLGFDSRTGTHVTAGGAMIKLSDQFPLLRGVWLSILNNVICNFLKYV